MDEAIRDLFEAPEGHRLDFKRTPKLEDDDGLAKHLVAFANRYGGKLVFGITDNQELEGASIDQERAFESIRQVARTRCSPPVRFDIQFYDDQAGAEQTGDILVVDIHPRRLAPHAVVEGGNNAKRTYFIRSADESRIISDAEELYHLFVNSPDPSFVETMTTTIVHEHMTYESIRLRPSLRGWVDYRGVFGRLTSEDRQKLKERETEESDSERSVHELRPAREEEFGSRMIREVFPEVLFQSFRQWPADFWIRNQTSNEDEYQMYEQYTESISHSDLELTNERPALQELSIDLDDVFRYHGELLIAPRGTKVLTSHPSSANEPSKLVFERDNRLSIELELQFNENPTIVGPPLSYPGSVPNDVAPFTRRYDLRIDADFGFPDVEDPEIRLHQAFAQGVRSFVQHRWDMERFRNEHPDHELYRIGEKVNSIEEQLSEMDKKL